MLANFESRLNSIRTKRETRHDYIDCCNSIHCDIVAGIIRKENKNTNTNTSTDMNADTSTTTSPNANIFTNTDTNEKNKDQENIDRNEEFFIKLRSFVENQSERKKILLDCQSSSRTHQLLHGRY